MNAICKLVGTVCPYGELAGRIALAAIFLLAGISKIGGYDGTVGYMESQGVPGFLLPLVIILEVGGGAALVIGWQTRWAALALAGFCVLAALLFHFDFGDSLQQALFMKNIAIAGGLLVLCRVGAGPFSLDQYSKSGDS
ncbi:DoxX family protein [Candidatus Spongiihabitans sp.]|uniref:DoxX family protein n=1 Tax=Candidatus Spongiihabitans sp. TaxID=3101308 RepID=UPI003C7CC92C